jgi:H/ACA ribonucleoprotein complex subunit 4
MEKIKNKLPSDIYRQRLVKNKAKTNDDFGKNPLNRTIDELIQNCFINLDKPSGPTSHQVDSWVKKILEIEKIGHSGTLDPNATGVLPIGVGGTTKVLSALLPAGKEYVALMKLHKDVDKEKIKKTCKDFVGRVTQLPPVRSAVKRVRRKRSIYYLDIIQIKSRDVLFRVGCESGTYVRTICLDIGKKLGCGAHLAELRRTRVGHLNEKDSVYLQDLKDAWVFYKEENDESYLRKILLPVEKMFDHLPKIIVRDSAVNALCHGANLALPGVAEIDSDIKKDCFAVVFTLKNEAVALVKAMMNAEDIIQAENGFCADLQRVIIKKDTYPSVWKKS